MDEWITDFINDSTVQFRFSSYYFKRHFFIKISRQLPYHFRETIEYSFHWNHAHIQNNLLQITDTLVIRSTVSVNSGLCKSLAIDWSLPRSMTSSSNRFIKISNLSILTRIVLFPYVLCSFRGPFFSLCPFFMSCFLFNLTDVLLASLLTISSLTRLLFAQDSRL